MKAEISYDYIRGLIEGEGCFTFCTVGFPGNKKKLPTFSISMHIRDKNLLELVKEKLKLRNKIYEHKPKPRINRFNKETMCFLIVRDIGQLKNVIIPLCYKRLVGHKGSQFDAWIEKIGSDPAVPESLKILYEIHKSGFYDRENWLTKKFQ
jgi:hypothetical protein